MAETVSTLPEAAAGVAVAPSASTARTSSPEAVRGIQSLAGVHSPGPRFPTSVLKDPASSVDSTPRSHKRYRASQRRLRSETPRFTPTDARISNPVSPQAEHLSDHQLFPEISTLNRDPISRAIRGDRRTPAAAAAGGSSSPSRLLGEYVSTELLSNFMPLSYEAKSDFLEQWNKLTMEVRKKVVDRTTVKGGLRPAAYSALFSDPADFATPRKKNRTCLPQ